MASADGPWASKTVSNACDNGGQRRRSLSWAQPNGWCETVVCRRERTPGSPKQPRRLHPSSLRFRWDAVPRQVRHRGDVRHVLPRERIAVGLASCEGNGQVMPNDSGRRGFLSRGKGNLLLMTSFQLRAPESVGRAPCPMLHALSRDWVGGRGDCGQGPLPHRRRCIRYRPWHVGGWPAGLRRVRRLTAAATVEPAGNWVGAGVSWRIRPSDGWEVRRRTTAATGLA